MESFQARCEKLSALYEPRSLLEHTCEKTSLAFRNCGSWRVQRGKGRQENRAYAPIGHGSLFLELSLALFLAGVFTDVKAHASAKEEKLST